VKDKTEVWKNYYRITREQRFLTDVEGGRHEMLFHRVGAKQWKVRR
jgi:hypothetical protein